MADDFFPSRLPPHELTAFHSIVGEAVEFACAGEILNGYRCLLGGVDRAQEAVEDGEPWGPELVARYRIALDRYGEKWGVKPG